MMPKSDSIIEVFKTNVDNHQAASYALSALKSEFCDIEANFDLEDHERILKVVSLNGQNIFDRIQQFLFEIKIEAEILPD